MTRLAATSLAIFEGVLLLSSTHPRAYGNFVRVLGEYARDEHLTPWPEAMRRLAALSAHNLGLHDRRLLKDGQAPGPRTRLDGAEGPQVSQAAGGWTW